MKQNFLTIKEVADRLRVSERSVFRYIHTRRLKAFKLGCWRILDSDLNQFVKANANITS